MPNESIVTAGPGAGYEKTDAVSESLALLEASRLVANGELEEAEILLCRTANPPSSCAALDLLARISVQKGQFDKARRLWLAVLEKDSAHAAAKSALARLDSPWLAWAIIKRLGVLAAYAIVLLLAAMGVMALFCGQRCTGSSRTCALRRTTCVAGSKGTGLAQHSPVASVEGQPAIVPAPAIGDRAGAAFRKPPPVFSVPDCTVSTNATETRIVFNNGLFPYRCEFNKSARERLAVAAKNVAEHAIGCWIVVEGHTDADPVPPNSLFRDNYALGLHRALAAVEVMQASVTIPPQNISAAAAGDGELLFPGDDYDTKLKNRTVVIRLLPKTAGELTTKGDSNEPAR
jgi:outer membrane protein OmpA-like peptidoglycan-associated protein